MLSIYSIAVVNAAKCECAYRDAGRRRYEIAPSIWSLSRAFARSRGQHRARPVQARQARIFHGIYLRHACPRPDYGGFSIVTRRRERAAGRAARSRPERCTRRRGRFTLKKKGGRPLSLSLSAACTRRDPVSVSFCLLQGRRRDRIILCRFSCFPVLEVVYAVD